MTPAEAAQWMVVELVRVKWLDQETVAWELHRRDKSLTYDNANGNLAIDKSVLAAFNKLAPAEEVVWSRSYRQWRYREAYDAPGRMQD